MLRLHDRSRDVQKTMNNTVIGNTDGYSEEIGEAYSVDEAEELLESWIRDGDWHSENKTQWIHGVAQWRG